MNNKDKFTVRNWNKEANAVLVMWSGIIGSITAFTPQFLAVVHESPIPISPMLDVWVTWILKLATITLALFSIFTKKKEDGAER